MSELLFLFDKATNYISFGLALYAIGAVVALVWMRRRKGGHMSQAATADVVRAGACVIVLVLLEALRQFWDSFHDQHFPVWIARALLPGLYFMLGNSIFKLTTVDDVDTSPSFAGTEAGRSAS